MRFTPKPVFGSDNSPNNYGLAIAFPDLDGVNRSSARFVCHSQSEKPLKAFHFKLVEIYCGDRSGIVTCRDLQHNKQARTTIYSWYRTEPIDLCQFVSCRGDLGARRKDQISDQLADKIVLLYSDIPGTDEHMTMVNTRKGAEILASLIEELQFGVAPHWRVSVLKLTLELIVTGLLVFLFHWRHTQSWAILIAGVFFALYLYLVPRLAIWVPDFRNYVLAVILAFWIEVLAKAAWNSLAGRH